MYPIYVGTPTCSILLRTIQLFNYYRKHKPAPLLVKTCFVLTIPNNFIIQFYISYSDASIFITVHYNLCARTCTAKIKNILNMVNFLDSTFVLIKQNLAQEGVRLPITQNFTRGKLVYIITTKMIEEDPISQHTVTNYVQN